MAKGSADTGAAYVDALHMLGRRELSVAQCRTRLGVKGHSTEEIDVAVARLLDTGALDDRRVARAFVRTAVNLKNRGRLRIQRELKAKGIATEVVADALSDVLDGADEQALVAKALQKKLRGRTRLEDRAESARVYGFLMRQGFTPAAIVAALRRLRAGGLEE